MWLASLDLSSDDGSAKNISVYLPSKDAPNQPTEGRRCIVSAGHRALISSQKHSLIPIKAPVSSPKRQEKFGIRSSIPLA